MTGESLPPAAAGTLERTLSRESDGVLHDAAARRHVGLDELRQQVRAGGVFRVQDRATGGDCTFQVLAAVLGTAVPAPVRSLLDTVSGRTSGDDSGTSPACPHRLSLCAHAPEDEDGTFTCPAVKHHKSAYHAELSAVGDSPG